MAVKPGYKQSEVGVIPVDWDVKRLGDLATVRDGTHQTPKYVAAGVPFFSVEHVTSGDFANTKFISEKEHRFLTRSFKIENGDVLMTRIGSIGDCKLIDWDVRASFYVSLALLKIHGASAAFVAQYSNSAAFKAEIELHSLQSAIPKKINLGPISDVRISVPPLSEQHAIATALGDVDALLSALERLIAKRRDLKQAALQQLLTGQTRLPGFRGEWEVKSLSAFCSMKSGEGITSASIDEFSKYPCYGGNGVRGFTSRFTHEGSYGLVGRQGALCGNVFSVEGQFFASEHAIVVTPSATTDIRWLTYVLGRMNLNQYSESSAQPGLSVSKLLILDVMAPPTKAEQTAIAAVLSDMDAELAVLEQRLAKTRALKQGMMQELLTGRIRLL
ncbi:restriction endonuclease subunit S [Pseudomonas lundensis]|uniref:restriction endonuclease subunit S n=1 Tax=Pseudomonas lundensis TaxID=86185 RepID=UPI0014744ACF|nr:restriction endonuclease subunit S [Pseudomonas lundensis]NNA07662.1 restriction endonuclease subunit S [Pseudomonas lundensis]